MTVYLTESADGRHLVRVRMAFCQHRDMYCKKTGRDNARYNPCVDFTCNARHVVNEINAKLSSRPAWQHMDREEFFAHMENATDPLMVGDWVFKYLM